MINKDNLDNLDMTITKVELPARGSSIGTVTVLTRLPMDTDLKDVFEKAVCWFADKGYVQFPVIENAYFGKPSTEQLANALSGRGDRLILDYFEAHGGKKKVLISIDNLWVDPVMKTWFVKAVINDEETFDYIPRA